jgi:hypothetical protein
MKEARNHYVSTSLGATRRRSSRAETRADAELPKKIEFQESEIPVQKMFTKMKLTDAMRGRRSEGGIMQWPLNRVSTREAARLEER